MRFIFMTPPNTPQICGTRCWKPARNSTWRLSPPDITAALKPAFCRGTRHGPRSQPFEVGLGWQVDLAKDEFIGKEALTKIKEDGVTHKLCGVRMGGTILLGILPILSCL